MGKAGTPEASIFFSEALRARGGPSRPEIAIQPSATPAATVIDRRYSTRSLRDF